MLDKIPAWARHLVLIFAGAAGAVYIAAVVKAQGVFGVPWVATTQHAIDAGALAAVVAVGVLYVTPLTHQYGVFKDPAQPEIPPADPASPETPND